MTACSSCQQSYRFLSACSQKASCVFQEPFLFPLAEREMVLILQRERRPEEVSSGLLAETGSLREEPGSPLKQFRVAAGHAFRCRCAILLTKSVPRTNPRLAGSQPRQRRERSEAIPRTAERRNVLVLGSALFFLTPGAALSFFSCKNEKKDRGAHLAASLLPAGGKESIPLSAVGETLCGVSSSS